MTVTYSDYGKKTENDFARLKGSKQDNPFLKAIFDEAKLYKHENSYVLAGYFTIIGGVSRAYGSDAISPGLCEISIYGSEYEIREKNPDTKQWDNNKYQPSINEKILYEHIESNPSQYIQDGKALKGEITFQGDEALTTFFPNEADRKAPVLAAFKVELVDVSSKYPEWIPPKGYRNNGNGNYTLKGISIDDRVTFLKKELGQAIKSANYRENAEKLSVSAFVETFINENRHNPDYLAAYFSLIEAIIK
jgi:hypothetical protein